jgi:predicted DNA-binding protein
MSIELPCSVEEQIRNLAAKQGRDVRTLVEEAVRQYLESAAITDLEPTQVAEAGQAARRTTGCLRLEGRRRVKRGEIWWALNCPASR